MSKVAIPSWAKRPMFKTVNTVNTASSVNAIGPARVVLERPAVQLEQPQTAERESQPADIRTAPDRHKPGYMAAYMRQYRAKKKETK